MIPLPKKVLKETLEKFKYGAYIETKTELQALNEFSRYVHFGFHRIKKPVKYVISTASISKLGRWVLKQMN